MGKSFKGKAIYCDSLIFLPFPSVFLLGISSKITFQDEEGEKEDPTQILWNPESLTEQFSFQTRKVTEKETHSMEEGSRDQRSHHGPPGSPELG